MALLLPRLPWAISIIEADGRPTVQLQSWWQVTTKALEDAFATGAANDAAITAAQADLTDAIAQLTQAVADIADLQTDVQDRQPLSDTLTGISDVGYHTGLLYQDDAASFVKKNVGVATADDIPSRGDGDGRWVLQDQTAAPTVAAYAGTAIANPPTQANVQAVDAALVQLRTDVANLVAALQTVNVLT